MSWKHLQPDSQGCLRLFMSSKKFHYFLSNSFLFVPENNTPKVHLTVYFKSQNKKANFHATSSVSILNNYIATLCYSLFCSSCELQGSACFHLLCAEIANMSVTVPGFLFWASNSGFQVHMASALLTQLHRQLPWSASKTNQDTERLGSVSDFSVRTIDPQSIVQ